jgi:hypothetical protein
MNVYKKCYKCKKKKLSAEFGSRVKTKDGLNNICKACHAKNSLEYRKRKNGSKLSYRPVSGEFSSFGKESDYIHEHCLVCNESFIPTSKINMWCTTCSQLIKNKIVGVLSIRGYVSQSTYTEVTIKYIKSTSCCYCSREYTDQNPRSCDHIIPVCLGGTNNPDNINISCLECNMSKAGLSLNQWIELCRLIVKNN